MEAILKVVVIIVVVVLVAWVGLRIKPTAFPAFSNQKPDLETVPLPSGLPAPVERFYRQTYGDQIPVIKTAVVSGRGEMKFLNVFVPIRFRFTHEACQTFRHDIELTLFGLPFIKGFETLIDGHGWANMPGMTGGEGFDQGSNVSLWAEALNWFPAALLTDPRVQWKPVDASTALLEVPYGSGKEVFVVRFDHESGSVQYVEAMKFKSAIGKKMLWTNGTWFDEGKPWIILNVEDTLFNVDVANYIRAPRP